MGKQAHSGRAAKARAGISIALYGRAGGAFCCRCSESTRETLEQRNATGANATIAPSMSSLDG
jgi:hypothetical protein